VLVFWSPHSLVRQVKHEDSQIRRRQNIKSAIFPQGAVVLCFCGGSEITDSKQDPLHDSCAPSLPHSGAARTGDSQKMTKVLCPHCSIVAGVLVL